MQMNLPLFPDGLDSYLVSNLIQIVEETKSLEPQELLAQVNIHLKLTQSKSVNNPMIHIRLAGALAQVYSTLVNRWVEIPEHVQPWVKGSMLYFVKTNDAEHDFESPIGFEDDVEVLNACLRLAGLNDLCLNPEDFD